MLSLVMWVALVAAPHGKCETYAPRIDGTVVTVCAGSVVRVCDAHGTCRERGVR